LLNPPAVSGGLCARTCLSHRQIPDRGDRRAGGAGDPIDPAHLAAVLEGLARAKRREFATDDEVEAAFRRFDR